MKFTYIFFIIAAIVLMLGAADADRGNSGNHTNKGNPTPGRPSSHKPHPTGASEKKHTKNPNASPNASG
uniref:Uncharacterized protein n=2 Tax=gambiae species complex TaxID=44542 RepID=A0A182HHB3_ANOAR